MNKLSDTLDKSALFTRVQGEFFLVDIPEEWLIELMVRAQNESAEGTVSMVHLPNGLDKDLFGEIPNFH